MHYPLQSRLQSPPQKYPTPHAKRQVPQQKHLRALLSHRPIVRGVSNALLLFYLAVIGAISLYDMILTVRYAESLKQLELNPIGRWLMQLDHIPKNSIPDVSFLLAKGFGTAIVLLVIFWITRRRARLGHPIGMGVSLCQILLAVYLCYGSLE
jgi:hypothetical protein